VRMGANKEEKGFDLPLSKMTIDPGLVGWSVGVLGAATQGLFFGLLFFIIIIFIELKNRLGSR
jgi:hypothetical protein